MRTSLLAFGLCVTILCLSSAQLTSAEGDLLDFVKKTIQEHSVVIFSKSYCPYCKRAKETLGRLNVTPFAIELDQRDDGYEIQGALADFIGRRTVPQVFIDGNHLGGSDDTSEAFESGRLAKLLKKSGPQEL